MGDRIEVNYQKSVNRASFDYDYIEKGLELRDFFLKVRKNKIKKLQNTFFDKAC